MKQDGHRQQQQQQLQHEQQHQKPNARMLSILKLYFRTHLNHGILPLLPLERGGCAQCRDKSHRRFAGGHSRRSGQASMCRVRGLLRWFPRFVCVCSEPTVPVCGAFSILGAYLGPWTSSKRLDLHLIVGVLSGHGPCSALS